MHVFTHAAIKPQVPYIKNINTDPTCCILAVIMEKNVTLKSRFEHLQHNVGLISFAAFAALGSVSAISPILVIIFVMTCPLLGTICKLSEHGLLEAVVTAFVIVVTSSTLSLHYIARLSWLVSTLSGLTAISSLVFLAPLISIVGNITATAMATIGFLAAFLIHTLIFIKLKKWPVVSILVATAFLWIYWAIILTKQ